MKEKKKKTNKKRRVNALGVLRLRRNKKKMKGLSDPDRLWLVSKPRIISLGDLPPGERKRRRIETVIERAIKKAIEKRK